MGGRRSPSASKAKKVCFAPAANAPPRLFRACGLNCACRECTPPLVLAQRALPKICARRSPAWALKFITDRPRREKTAYSCPRGPPHPVIRPICLRLKITLMTFADSVDPWYPHRRFAHRLLGRGTAECPRRGGGRNMRTSIEFRRNAGKKWHRVRILRTPGSGKNPT